MYSENAGIASNPANGINNIHLGGGDSSRVSKNQLNKLLKETIDANPETVKELKAVYEDFILKVQDENVKKKFKQYMTGLPPPKILTLQTDSSPFLPLPKILPLAKTNYKS